MSGRRPQADVTTEKQAASSTATPVGRRPRRRPRGELDAADPLDGTRYRSVRVLGQGGMATVYLAEHRDLGRTFAVKVLDAELGADSVVIERMRREARTASQIRHPGIVDVTDVGTTPDGRAFIVMEHLEGPTLAALISEEGRVDQARTLRIGARICEALAAAHAHDVIHRDVKPANIVLLDAAEGREQVKIVDFGIALSPEHAAGRLTQLGTMPGTPVYMAPEQATTRTASVLTDVYATGVVLFEMLTGAPPFDEPTAVETMARKLRNDPLPPSRRARGARIAPVVDAVVLRALARSPERRTPSMEALGADIDVALDELRHGPRRRIPGGRAAAAALAALALAAVAVGGGVAMVRLRARERAEEGAPRSAAAEADGGGLSRREAESPGERVELLVASPDEVDGGEGGSAAADGGADVGPPADAGTGDWSLGPSDGGPGRDDTGPASTMGAAARRESARHLVDEGRRHLAARRLGEARDAYSRAARLDPGSVEAQGGLGRVAFEQGRYAEAAGHLERALRRQPRATALRVVLGSAYLRMGQTGRAVNEWETVLRQDPTNRAAQRLLDSVR